MLSITHNSSADISASRNALRHAATLRLRRGVKPTVRDTVAVGDDLALLFHLGVADTIQLPATAPNPIFTPVARPHFLALRVFLALGLTPPAPSL